MLSPSQAHERQQDRRSWSRCTSSVRTNLDSGAARRCRLSIGARLELTEFPETLIVASPGSPPTASRWHVQDRSFADRCSSTWNSSRRGSSERIELRKPKRRSSLAYWPMLAPTSITQVTPRRLMRRTTWKSGAERGNGCTSRPNRCTARRAACRMLMLRSPAVSAPHRIVLILPALSQSVWPDLYRPQLRPGRRERASAGALENPDTATAARRQARRETGDDSLLHPGGPHEEPDDLHRQQRREHAGREQAVPAAWRRDPPQRAEQPTSERDEREQANHSGPQQNVTGRSCGARTPPRTPPPPG